GGPPGAGVVAVGGAAFAPDGGADPAWDGFPPASLHVPEAALARRGDEVALTLTTLVAPDDTEDDVCGRIAARAAELRGAGALPLFDPDPAGGADVRSAMPPEHFTGAVARATERIRAGALEKVVLAREVSVRARAAHDPGAILGILRAEFPA